MSNRPIIGNTVGTPVSAAQVERELKPVKTVNNVTPDENGNVNVDLPEHVKTVNNVTPDENGNVNVDLPEHVKTVNNVTPDENGNVNTPDKYVVSARKEFVKMPDTASMIYKIVLEMSDGETVEVELPSVPVSADTPEDYVILSNEDPTMDTEGYTAQLLVNTVTAELWVCTSGDTAGGKVYPYKWLNIAGGSGESTGGLELWSKPMELTEAEKTQARENIGVTEAVKNALNDAVESGVFGGEVNRKYHMDGDEICDYYAINQTGEAVLASGYGCSSYIPCGGCRSMAITMVQHTAATKYGLAFYDEGKQFISFVPSQVGGEVASVQVTVEVPENARYFRTTFFNYEQQKTYGDFSCDLVFSVDTMAGGKRPYQDGYIFFSQRVNQNITRYWETAEAVKHGADYKVTTGVIALPETYSQTGKKTPLIVYAHGLSHYVYYGAWGNTDTFREQKQHWLDMGFAVMDCNGARDNNRAGQFASGICPQGVNAYKQAVDYVVRNYNVDPEIYLIGGSCGGAVAWNYLAMYGSNVKAAVMISVWADSEYNAWGGGGTNTRKLFVEYLGFNDTNTYEVDKTIGFDQKYRIVTIGDKDYCFMPYNVPIYGLYGGTESSLITPMKKTFAALRNAGAAAQIRGVAGCGHEIVSGANIVVDTEIGNWFLSHSGLVAGAEIPEVPEEPEDPTVYYTVTRTYMDGNDTLIKLSTTESVAEGTVIDFVATAPTIEGYQFVSVTLNSATVTSDLSVRYVYEAIAEPEPPVVDGDDLSVLFTFDRKNWMAVVNQFKTSSNFMSCFTDLSAYAGRTIEITVPQYTASNGQSSTGMSAWCTQPVEDISYVKTRVKEWDTDTNGNGKGVLVPVRTTVPADAPYLWTSTYMPDVAAYVGPNDGLTDFYCKLIDEDPTEPEEPKYYTITYNYTDASGVQVMDSTTESVAEGTAKNFTDTAPTVDGYTLTSVSPTSATITSDLTVTYVYEAVAEPDEPEPPVVEGNDLTALFTFDREKWMAVSNPLWKTSTYFMSCFTDLSAYVGKTIEFTIPQYTASNGASSTGMSMWCTEPVETASAIHTRIKVWDTDTNGNGKGVLVPIQTTVPAEAPYLWTSTYMPSVAAYVGPNDGLTDFYCKLIDEEPDVPEEPAEYCTITYRYIDPLGTVLRDDTTETVLKGTEKTFTDPGVYIGHYVFSYAQPGSAVVTEDMQVACVYTPAGGDH